MLNLSSPVLFIVVSLFYIFRGNGRHDISVDNLGCDNSPRLHGSSTCFTPGLRHRCQTDAHYVPCQHLLQRSVRELVVHSCNRANQ